MATLSKSASANTGVSFGGVAKAALIGAAIAAVGNVIVWALAGVANIPLTVMAGPPGSGAQAAQLAVVQVIFFSVLPAILGGLLYFVLRKITARGTTIFTVIAVVIALLSLLPITGQPLTPPGMLVLVVMHLLAASAITWALTTRS